MNYTLKHIKIKSNWFDSGGKFSKMGIDAFLIYLTLFRFRLHNQDYEFTFLTSISYALRHEYQHFLDDKAKGFPSLDVTYEFKNRIIMELRAYMVEIKEAERIGNKALAEHLWNNYRDERQYLLENYGPVKLD
ncbi:hypothetical protein [Paenibacillus sp. FSL L8-0158]|uniref:hypothetical protein n=1 Tax=Paenibacillus sp. FSL L8-0158 TaxID=2954752 RepID=UPI003158D6D5